jgi:hypothetical protein
MAETTCCMASKWAAPGGPSAPCRVRGWLMLCIWIAAVALFMLVVGPALLQRSALRPMAEMIEARGIEANMYFYTEVEAFYDANVNMDNTWAYPRRAGLSPGPNNSRDN